MLHPSRLLLAFACLFAVSANAEPVRLVHEGRGLDGELKLAQGRTAKDGLFLLVHGTLAHNRMEIMTALQDVQANGPSAMQKYANDPEIMSVVKELQEILG